MAEACQDGLDNDGDGLTDFPADPGCDGPDDTSEMGDVASQCSDQLDNDEDGTIISKTGGAMTRTMTTSQTMSSKLSKRDRR